MKRRPLKNNMGTVSRATMRAEDLIPAFISELRNQRPLHRADRALIRGIEASINRGIGGEDYWQSEQCNGDVQSLFDALNNYCLPYFYFGAHPSDGSDYGYWLSDEWEQGFDGIKVDDLSEVPKGYTGEVLEVNDHGNMTLYAYSRGRGREIWGLV